MERNLPQEPKGFIDWQLIKARHWLEQIEMDRRNKQQRAYEQAAEQLRKQVSA